MKEAQTAGLLFFSESTEAHAQDLKTTRVAPRTGVKVTCQGVG